MTQAESAEITMMLAAAYSSWRPPVETLRLYAAVLEPLPAEVAREATMRIIRSDREFAPPCGAIWSEAVKFVQETAGRPPHCGRRCLVRGTRPHRTRRKLSKCVLVSSGNRGRRQSPWMVGDMHQREHRSHQSALLSNF